MKGRMMLEKEDQPEIEEGSSLLETEKVRRRESR